MPRIFDNIEQRLLPALQETLTVADHSDFCVGYFNLRGWKQLDSYIERYAGGEGKCCRLLVGMQRLPQDDLRTVMSLIRRDAAIDNQTALRLKTKLAEEFREQLELGVPTDEDEAGLRRLAAQIRAKKVRVKLFLRHPLHAKLYLLFRPDPVNPAMAFLGSSNLTFAGLSHQGELNVDVMDHDACQKLAKWFEDRWSDRWCIDVSKELADIIESSWARTEPVPPYHIYLKIAWHLSKEARDGLTEFQIPKDFGNKLFEFQKAAVQIAAHHLHNRYGVLLGDVVGLGKTLIATALARIFEDDQGMKTLILCPKNLVPMWEDYRQRYGLRGTVLSLSMATRELPKLPGRYRLVLIDESHNLRNREGKTYRAIQEYVAENESRVILLSATPYNKTYLDLSNQLRLFVAEGKNIGVRPERLLRQLGEDEFTRRYQCPVRSLAAFEHSDYADDWRDLMRRYLVRRTRSFIKDNYAKTDPATGRMYLTFEDGTKSFFPDRIPKRAKFTIDDKDPNDQYAKMYAPRVVDAIEDLTLPRYGLGNYVAPAPHTPPTPGEAKIIDDLSRAGKRLMGFCRTNLFKRLESGGFAFIQSIERHILRNFVYLHAIENGLPLPIGTQDMGLLDARVYDGDEALPESPNGDDGKGEPGQGEAPRTPEDFKARAADVYDGYAKHYQQRFKWLRADVFIPDLAMDLEADALALLEVLKRCGQWDPAKDTKLDALADLLTKQHPKEKVIVFTQFADTVRYLERQLQARGIDALAGVTGDSPNPTALAWRFSPVSNEKRDSIPPDDDLRILVATDVLSEGQNLQDCAIVVNFDLPWAIIRLVQRVGRVDRIGQKAQKILCYSFLPADGVERIIHLRSRVRQRLTENAEVVGTDEAFFEDDRDDRAIRDLFTEKAGLLDGDTDTEVDLASQAYQIWKNAIDADPKLEKVIAALPNVVYSTRPHSPTGDAPEGVLVYLRTGDDNDALAWVDKKGNIVTESQLTILRAAECKPETPALPRLAEHHALVKKGVDLIVREQKNIGGQLGRPSGARRRTYDRLKGYAEDARGTLFEHDPLFGAIEKAIEEIYRHPLRQLATDILNRQLRSGVADEELARLVVNLREDGRLCLIHDDEESQEPRIICSMGLSANKDETSWFRPPPKPQAKLPLAQAESPAKGDTK